MAAGLPRVEEHLHEGHRPLVQAQLVGNGDSTGQYRTVELVHGRVPHYLVNREGASLAEKSEGLHLSRLRGHEYGSTGAGRHGGQRLDQCDLLHAVRRHEE